MGRQGSRTFPFEDIMPKYLLTFKSLSDDVQRSSVGLSFNEDDTFNLCVRRAEEILAESDHVSRCKVDTRVRYCTFGT